MLVFKDRSRATMQYSLPRDGRQGDVPRSLHDWICCLVSWNLYSDYYLVKKSFNSFFSVSNSAVFKISAVGRAASNATNLDATPKRATGRTKLASIRRAVSLPNSMPTA